MYLFYCFLALVSLVNANIYYDFNNELKNSRNFTGKVVLVTGSTTGIGKEITKLFTVLGANVVVNARNADDVKRVAKELQELSPKKLKPLEVVVDVIKTDDLNRLLNQTIKTFEKLDILVNNAGIGLTGGIKDKNFMQGFDQTINTNLRSYVQMSQLSVPYLERTNGTIISISSISSMTPHGLGFAYTVSKAAIDMMTRVLALELGPKIRVNTVNPGIVLTEKFQNSKSPFIQALLAQAAKAAPLKRLTSTLDVAKGVVFLASSDAQFITGANLVIDGGFVHNIGA